MITILGWNVNGLRALHRQGYWDKLMEVSPDIFCFQETKASPDQLEDEVRSPASYNAYFASSTVRKGYSGVSIHSKIEPEEVKVGLGIDKYDEQGRVLTLVFPTWILVNVYVPNGNSKTAPLEYKLGFYEALLEHMEEYRAEGKEVILTGDLNVAHTEIDLARPKENSGNIGFLPEERAWIDEYIEAGYIDVWRSRNENKRDVYTYWDMQSRARERNVGWRIDYFFATPGINNKIKSVDVHNDMFGSDHCPISITLDI